jgi:hypothetical protein
MPATKKTTQDPLKTAVGKLDLLYFKLQLISLSEKLLTLVAGNTSAVAELLGITATAASTSSSVPRNVSRSIPEPKGESGRKSKEGRPGYNLQEASRLSPENYKKLFVSIIFIH